LEKRYRADWPEFSVSTFLSGKWGERVDAWMSDRIPARDFLVGVDSYVWYFSGRQSARDVFTDVSGNLIDAPPEYSIAELYKRLDRITGLVNAVHSLSSTTPSGTPPGATVSAVLVPPDAGSISLLPTHIKNCYADDLIFDAIAEYIDNEQSEGGAGVTFVDLRADLYNADSEVFYRTDHHWNADGAYIAYTALGAAFGFTPLPKESFSIDTVDYFYGSTYAKSGLWLTKPDRIELWTPPCPLRVNVINHGQEPVIYDNVFFYEFLSGWDMYSVFLGGINGLTIIENLGGSGGGTLFMVKDSYANSLIPLLIAHFDKIVAVDLRRFDGKVSDLYNEHADTDGNNAIAFVYSMNHIMNDTDLLLLR